MKQKSLIIVVIILLVTNAVTLIGYYHKNTKDYEAACLQADFIRYLIDHFDGETECANIGSEIEECYYEYFTDIEDYGTSIKDVKEFDRYYWCY